MLRKIFSSATNVKDALPVVDENSWDHTTGFPQLLRELEDYEERLKHAINVFSRQCQSVSELVTSTDGFAAFVTSLAENECLPNGQTDDTSQASTARKNQQEAIQGELDSFRMTAIAPLQSLLAEIPQLRVRCDHRKSAMSIMLRYEKKMDELRSSSRSTETSRMQRNRAKLVAVTARFHELDEAIRRDIKAFMEQDVISETCTLLQKLLLQAHDSTANFLLEQSTGVQKHLETIRSRHATSKQESPKDTVESTPNLHERNQSENPETSENQEATDSFPTEPSLSTPAQVAKQQGPTQAEGIQIMPRHVLSENQSIRPRKKHTHGTRTWKLHRQVKDSMARGLDMIECVQLPDGCMQEEWIAVHVIDFFNEISLLYGTITEFCTTTACPQMTAGPCYTYLWADGVQQVTPISLPASEYVDRLLKWVEDQLNNDKLFPADGKYNHGPSNDGPNAAEFVATAKVIFKRLFRVYAHMYHSHMENYRALAAEPHLNFCFKRFVLFIQQFQLVEQKELNALRKLIHTLVAY